MTGRVLPIVSKVCPVPSQPAGRTRRLPGVGSRGSLNAISREREGTQMKLLDRILGRTSRRPARGAARSAQPCLEALEDRTLPAATGALAGTTLTITTTANT